MATDKVIWKFSCTLSGSYAQGGAVGTPGETLNFNGAANPFKLARPKIPGSPAGRLPANSDCQVTKVPAGYSATLERNASSPTPANFALRIFTAGSGAAAPAELGAGAYPAALSGDLLGITMEISAPLKYN